MRNPSTFYNYFAIKYKCYFSLDSFSKFLKQQKTFMHVAQSFVLLIKMYISNYFLIKFNGFII